MPVTQKASIAHLATDPLRNFKFLVNLHPPANSPVANSVLSLGFMAVSGININIDVIAYRQGSYNTVTQKMPGQADFSPITLSRGVAVGTDYAMAWLRQLFTVMQGTGNSSAGSDFRFTVDIAILDHPVTTSTVPVNAAFRVFNAWPTAVAFSDLDAGANQLFIEQITLAHEGWDYQLSKTLGADAPHFTDGGAVTS